MNDNHGANIDGRIMRRATDTVKPHKFSDREVAAYRKAFWASKGEGK